MPRFNVNPQKESRLAADMEKLGLHEADIEERFIKGSGPGGQKINKTSSCVVLLHRPTGIEVRCQRERSQALNRFLARRTLCERVRTLQAKEQTERERAAEKIRRQKRRRSRRQRARMLADKRHRAQKKEARRPVDLSE